MILPIEEVALSGQIVCGNTKCPEVGSCFHAEPHDEVVGCWSCGDSPGCLPVEEVVKLAAIEAAEDEGFGRRI
jgi:hypothetical protein